MYTCGPTVYNPAHLGNFRTFLFEDLLRRALRLRGWNVVQVMNLTDVDDKIIKRAHEQGKTITRGDRADHRDLSRGSEVPAHRGRRGLSDGDGLHPADDRARRATARRRGSRTRPTTARCTSRSTGFPAYGRLSRLDTREIKTGARVAQDDYTKENAQDFALWKAAKPEDEATGAAWDAPFGRGRPGWHLECSAMAMKYLGETLDIHCGGVDLDLPASRRRDRAVARRRPGSRSRAFWCHGEFLLIDGTKMAKRVGNVSTVADLREQGISAAALRHFVFTTHYRKQLNLSGEALEASIEAVRADRRVRRPAARRRRAGRRSWRRAAETAEREFEAALFDDLNAPEALAALFTFISGRMPSSTARAGCGGARARACGVFALIDGVLDLEPRALGFGRRATSGSGTRCGAGLADGVERVGWAVASSASGSGRQRRDFAASDAIRAEVEEPGVCRRRTRRTGRSWSGTSRPETEPTVRSARSTDSGLRR